MKRQLGFLFLILMIGLAFSACGGLPENASETVCNFMDIKWERDIEGCVETIYFNSDGDCGYYCGCGEPLNCDDLCEGYRYDEKSRTIHLEFSGLAIGAADEIYVLHCDSNLLVLDFDGEERTFKNTKTTHKEKDPTVTYLYKGNEYRYIQFPQDIFYYDLKESVDCEEGEKLLIPHDRWTVLYEDGDLWVLKTQADEAIAYFADDANYVWRIAVEDPNSEEVFLTSFTPTDEELRALYGMEDRTMEQTLLFDDIEVFGTLEKVDKNSLISARTSLAFANGTWYWRSETIDENAKGWPEYVIPLPESLQNQIQNPN